MVQRGAIGGVNLRDAAGVRRDLRDYMRIDRKFIVPTGNLKTPLRLPSRGLACYVRLMRVPCAGQISTACPGLSWFVLLLLLLLFPNFAGLSLLVLVVLLLLLVLFVPVWPGLS